MIVIVKVNSKLGNKLRKLRLQYGITRKQMAEMFGITISAVGMYEQGRRMPGDDIKKKYSMLFGESIDDIFF